MLYLKPIFWKPKMLVCTLRGEGGGCLKMCTVCTLMKMLTFLDDPLLVLLVTMLAATITSLYDLTL